MQEVMSFFGDVNTPVAFATSDGDKPSVRFFSFKMVEDGKLYFLTSNKKNVYSDLSKNPKVEICSMPNANQEWLRLNATVAFDDNLALKKKAFEMLPMLKKAYGKPENEEVVLFYLENIEAKKHTLSGTVEEIWA
ncbi:pyridoxamine 5'-phosphate oxidase family protein [Fusibacter sp. JL298sf-3]